MPEDGPYYRNMQRVWTKVMEFIKFVVAYGSMYSTSLLIKRQIYRDARTLKVKAAGSSRTTTTLPVRVASYPTRLGCLFITAVRT